MAFRGEALELAGRFDESLPIYHEEVEWEERLRRAGGEVIYLPRAFLWHCRTSDDVRLRRLLRKRFRFGVGNAAVLAAAGAERSVIAALSEIPRLLGHSLKRGCWWGVLQTVQQLGFVYGITRYRAGPAGGSR